MLHCLSRRGGLTVTLCILLGLQASTQAFKFAELKGVPVNTAGWGFQGAGARGNTGSNPPLGEVILTTAVRRVSGAIFYNTPINLAQCNKWVAEYEFRIADGDGADGLAFCYLENPPVGFVNGGGLGVPADANGLKIGIDTWHNECENQMPKLQMRWGVGYKECEPTQPTYLNTGSELNFITNGGYHKARITYDKGNLTFSINGKQYLTGFQTFNFKGYFGFTASTGNSTNTHSIRNVTIYTDMPDITLMDTSLCSGATINIGPNNNNALYRYSWSPSNGLSNASTRNPNVTLTNNSTGTITQRYYLTTENTSFPGCNAVDSMDVKVFGSPAITYAASRLCTNDSLTITPTVTGTNSTVSYVWDFNDPNRPPAESMTSGPIGKYKYLQGGSYVVDITSTTSNGCKKTSSLPVTLSTLPPTTFEVLNDGLLCINENVLLVNRSNTPNGTTTKILPDAPNTTPVIAPTGRVGLNDTIKINYRQLRINEAKPFYVVSWSNTDAQGCVGTTLDTIQFLQQPKPTLTTLSGVCISTPPFQLNVGNETSGVAGAGYYAGNGIVDADGTFDAITAGVGVHRINYIYEADNGCTDTATQQLTVDELPQVSAGPDRYIFPGGSVQLLGEVNRNDVLVSWSPKSTLNDSSRLQPIAKPAGDQEYLLTVFTAQNCIAQDVVKVTLLPPLTVSNAFSPHVPDGINDQWNIRNLELFPEAYIGVFDRYGREVYKSRGYQTPWNGKINGVLVPKGVYYYVIDTRQGGNTKIAGSLLIL